MFLNLLINLPLKDPVLIFALILVIILIAPILLHRLRIPDLIVLILAGVVVGPHGLDVMDRDSSIELFGKVGLLYIMFIAGLEIDLADLRKNSGKSAYFGVLTFLIPMIIGTFSSVYLLGFSYPSSILLASMYASHTLITYPIVSGYGATKNRAVNITIGATVITCILSLLVLAIVVGMEQGDVSNYFWIRLGASTAIFIAIVMGLFPVVGRWFFKRYTDNITQYIFVLALVFLASFLAKLAGLEDIIGAFLAGLALNRLIPNTSALMNRIEFVGNALFIPFFLIGVGMLVDYKVFTAGWDALWVSVVMCVIATFSKYIASFITEKTFNYTKDEGRLMFGLSNSQAAATLAAVTVGHGVGLLNDNVLNGTVIMILVTCTIASFVTQKGARNVSLAEMTGKDSTNSDGGKECILIPVGNAETVNELINLGVTIKAAKSKTKMMALSIIRSDYNDPGEEKKAKAVLEKAEKMGASTDNVIQPLMRYDTDIANGIKNVAKENKVTDIVLGLRKEKEISDTFLGTLTETVLAKCATTTFVYRPVQPMSTIKRYAVVVPVNAELEKGFPYWVVRVWNLAQNTGRKMVFYGNKALHNILNEIKRKHSIDAEFKEFTNWSDFLILSRDIKEDDALMVVMSRRTYSSYYRQMEKIPGYMNKYFQNISCILLYPVQTGVGEDKETNMSLLGYYEDGDLAGVIGRLFKKK